MLVRGLDHVNIRTAQLADSIIFYRDILGMTALTPPLAEDFSKGAYLAGPDGQAIIHLVAAPVGSIVLPERGRANRGVADHFALACVDKDEVTARLTAQGLDYSAQDFPEIGAHLIFIRDPNDILVELKFSLG